MKVSKLFLPFELHDNYDQDQKFGPVFAALGGEFLLDPSLAEGVKRLLQILKTEGNRLVYGEKMCMIRTNARGILKWAHHSTLGGKFGFSKALEGLEKYHWKYETRDTRMYYRGCMICQQGKDRRTNLITVLTPFSVPQRRWGYVVTYLMTYLIM